MIGAKGRSRAGSAEVRIASYDVEEGRLVEGPDGLTTECAPGEVGMLLSRARNTDGGLLGTTLRSVFGRGDGWHVTGDLFRSDEDGDLWWVEHADRKSVV